MSWLRHNSLLGAVLLVTGVALVTEGAWLQRERLQAKQALAALDRKQQERAQLARQSPVLNEANEQALGRELAGAEERLQGLLSAFRDDDRIAPGAGAAPIKSLDAFLELADFVEKSRSLAVRCQVSVKKDERFGFAAYANEGPERDLVPAVQRQRRQLQFLLETLLAAHPQALLGVQRESPRRAVSPAVARGSVATAAGKNGHVEDYFDFDETRSLRVPGQVTSHAYRLEFTGRTQTLRALLSSLAASGKPVVVRSVEVDSASPGTVVVDRTLAGGSGAPVQLVAQNLSRFAIIVEFVEPLGPAGGNAP